MALFLQKVEAKEGVERYLKNGEEIRAVPTPSISKEEHAEFEVDQMLHSSLGLASESYGSMFRKYLHQEEENKLHRDILTAKKLNSLESSVSLSERRKAAQVEIFGALRQASLLSELTGLLRSSSLLSNSTSTPQSLGSHVTVSSSSQTSLFNDSERIMAIQNKLYTTNSMYANAEKILNQVDYLSEKVKSRRQQLKYIEQISKSSRKVSYFDKTSQQEHQPTKHQVSQNMGQKVPNVMFRKRFNCLQDILAIDCSADGLYAHPQNPLKLLPIPSVYSANLLQLVIETAPLYTIRMEMIEVKSQETLVSFNSWEGTNMYHKLRSLVRENVTESVNLLDILCAKQEHSSEMFAIFKLLMTEVKALPVSLVKYVGRLDSQWQEEFFNKTYLTYSRAESSNLAFDSNDTICSRAEFTVRCGATEYSHAQQHMQNRESDHSKKIIEGMIVDHIIITHMSDDSICCLINHEYSYKISLVHQGCGNRNMNSNGENVLDRTKIFKICLLDLQRSFIYNKEIMKTYYDKVNILAVKNTSNKMPDTLKLLPSSLSLLQYQLVFMELKSSLSSAMQKYINNWKLPIQYKWDELNLEYQLSNSSVSSPQIRKKLPSFQKGISHNPFILMPGIKITLELMHDSKSKRTPFNDLKNQNLYYRSPQSLYFSPATNNGFSLVKILPEYDDELSPLNEERIIYSPIEFDSIISAYVVQYVARLKLDRLSELLIEKAEEKRRKEKSSIQSDVPLLGYIWQKGVLIGDFDVINTSTGKVSGIGFPCIKKLYEDSNTRCSILYCFEFHNVVDKENVANMLKGNGQTSLIQFAQKSDTYELWDIGDRCRWTVSEKQLILDLLAIQ